ncbi:alpha/beta fold hydrolase [Roseobacter weihaiensis]|uniref:alpha/beta fold hydrolase n=1 Tax=Roseobacter weihaiensis TaxID=2763262 RepID=UPI001D0B6FCA|nr:alpha/beta hydrolase [Roseobacter sp. H9]
MCRVPTYIWLGDEDGFVPASIGDYLAAAPPDVELNVLPGKGHFETGCRDDILWACTRQIDGDV